MGNALDPQKALLLLALMVLDPDVFYHQLEGLDSKSLRDSETVNELKANAKLARILAVSLLKESPSRPIKLLLKSAKLAIAASPWSEIGEYAQVPALVQNPHGREHVRVMVLD